MIKRRRVLMLAFPDCQLLDVTGPMATFAGANEVLGRQAYDPGTQARAAQNIFRHERRGGCSD
jgi:transcriptional regulator GlxA family with amidase domain